MRRSWIIALVIAISATAWILSGLYLDSDANTAEQAEQPGESAAEETPLLPSVRVATVTAEPLQQNLALFGRTMADRKVTVRAEISGLIDTLEVDRGDPVTEDDLLVRIAVNEREIRVAEAEAWVQQREIDFNAAATLNQRGYTADTTRAEMAARLAQAQAVLELARLDLDRTHIRAPFTGVVEQRIVEIGDFVDIGDPIVEVVDLDPIRIRGAVSERHLGHLRRGMPGTAMFLDGQEVDGTISFVGTIANDVTRTFPVEIRIPNPDGRIIEGVTAELSLPTAQQSAHKLPPSVISLSDEGIVGVKAVDADDRVVFHPVQILGDGPDGIWLGGLPDTLQVIAVGQEFVRDGEIVRPVQMEATASMGGAS